MLPWDLERVLLDMYEHYSPVAFVEGTYSECESCLAIEPDHITSTCPFSPSRNSQCEWCGEVNHLSAYCPIETVMEIAREQTTEWMSRWRVERPIVAYLRAMTKALSA